MLRLSEIARLSGGVLHGQDVQVEYVGTDSRAAASGMLFVALKGPRFDGHAFLGDVSAQGAAAALVEQVEESRLPQVQVKDTLAALQTLAAAWRQRFRIPVVAITGSCGKTTVKEMLAAMLEQAGPCLSTRGNLNNHIGLPLTLLRLRPEHRFAVIEMGMNHAGELSLLTRLASPSVALINNARPAHIGNFNHVSAIAEAKGEILEGLDEQGLAVLNGDDPFVEYWAGKSPGAVLRFGMAGPKLDLRGRWQAEGEGGCLQVEAGGRQFDLRVPLPGEHNGANALAACAVGLHLGLSVETLQQGLAQMQTAPGRSQWRPGLAGSRVLDDTYNANPASLEAALKVLAARRGKRIFVFGNMAELGPDEQQFHREVGRQARELGVDYVFTLGDLASLAAESFGGQGGAYGELEDLLSDLCPLLDTDTTVLVKGSRSARMERVVEKIAI